MAYLDIPPAQIFVTFDVDIHSASFVQASEYHFDPAFLHSSEADPHDLEVIILSEEVTQWNGMPVAPVQLPPADLLDQLAAQGGLRGVSFVNVGYGVSPVFKGAPPSIDFSSAFYREESTSLFQGLTLALLRLLMNSDATGEGGVCYGDSGGPKFLPGTNMIVAVQRGGDPICRAESYAYRLDTPQARAFLGQFVTLP